MRSESILAKVSIENREQPNYVCAVYVITTAISNAKKTTSTKADLVANYTLGNGLNETLSLQNLNKLLLLISLPRESYYTEVASHGTCPQNLVLSQ